MGSIRRTFAIVAIATTSISASACGISRQQEVEIGASYSQQINQQLPLVEDAQVHRYINVLGEAIASQGGRQYEYTFYVVNADVINAFALPGGWVYINRGVIERSDNLAELAGVLAHEIGHVEERHGAEMMERAQQANIGINVAYILLGRPPGQLEQAAIQVGGGAVFAGYSRGAENEADAVAVDLLTRSGIDPNGLLTFFKELLEDRDRNPSAFEQWFSSHPLTEDRIAHVREEIARLNLTPAQTAGLTVTSQSYNDMKARLRSYPAPPPEYRRD
ncbi:MAG TPA: M48 family metallopeptidase [Longimicrobiales bacterium]|nr:M48 family metallopeptidase [Longimicrobiales bacterium]